MTDTSPKIASLVDSLMAQKSGAERIEMGFSMLAFSKEITISSIKAADSNLGPKAIRQQLFLRFYSDDFTEGQRKKILAGL